jgi:hypothetical protein
MLTINNQRISTPTKPRTDHVLPFYKDSIKCLFAIESLTDDCPNPTRNRLNIVSALRETLGEGIDGLSYLLDIRFQEELGSSSPQYEILSDLSLTNITPICMSGDNMDVIIKEGFSVLDSLLSKGEKALCLISLLSSAEWQYSGPEFIISFVAISDGESNGIINMKGRI